MDYTRPSSPIRFSVGVAFLAWLGAYVAALPLQAAAIALSGRGGDDPETWPISLTLLSVALLCCLSIASAASGGEFDGHWFGGFLGRGNEWVFLQVRLGGEGNNMTGRARRCCRCPATIRGRTPTT